MEGSKLPYREYPYFFIKLGKLYYVYHSYKNVKKKEVSSYEFTNDESLAFPIDEESAKQLADECGGRIVMKNATFNDYISQGESWSHFIDNKKKNIWRVYVIN
ncbi:hypothetical protein [Priestia megaterium]|uniref:hypothetical protein n=1 Tax=Priestia megaterium TaxID=1404 RepID=UPI002B251BB5|nr:hypothetical protein [Priestia megaterium]MEB2294606.1 hypothetical protein [Priestia megaterium]